MVGFFGRDVAGVRSGTASMRVAAAALGADEAITAILRVLGQLRAADRLKMAVGTDTTFRDRQAI